MRFKGTVHHRRIAVLMDEHYGRNFSDKSAAMYVADINELCDHIDKQSEVVEAARALISGDKRYRDDVLEQRCFEALADALSDLKEEGDG